MSHNPGLSPTPKTNWNPATAAWVLIALAITAVVVLSTSFLPRAEETVPAASSASNVTTIDVHTEGMRFVPEQISVPAGNQLLITLRNTDSMPHDLRVGKAHTGRVNPGDEVTLDAGVITTPVEGYCTVAGHRGAGMVLNIEVE